MTVDILFLGNSYYAFTIDPEVRSFIRSLDKSKVGKIVNFGSAAMLNSTYKKVKSKICVKVIQHQLKLLRQIIMVQPIVIMEFKLVCRII